MGALKVTVGDVTLGLDIDPEKGAADSGDLEIDLPNLFVAVAEAAEERKTAVAVLIDEIQYFNRKELGALIMAMHKVQQRQLPLVLLAAGLPILPGLASDSKSYAERLASRSTTGILLWHLLQTYFGVLVGTYIFSPQAQKTMPAKRCTGRLPILGRVPLAPSKMELHWSQSSGETIAGTSWRIHSCSGLNAHTFPPKLFFV